MSESEKSQNELNDFADALRSLVPLPSAVSRDELMFRAGQASVERTATASNPRRWLWPMATAACTLLATMIGMAVGQRNAELNHQFVQNTPASPKSDAMEVGISPAATSQPPSTGYLAERNRILARGVDSLPASGANYEAPASNSSYFELRDGLLHRDRS